MKPTRETPQRRLVQGLVEGNAGHPTADEIYELARRENSAISRGTVYRNLNILAESGKIVRLTMPVGPDHFDFNTDRHYHFLCRRCHRVLDAGIPYDERLNLVTPAVPGCVTEWHRLILVGLCPECSAQINGFDVSSGRIVI